MVLATDGLPATQVESNTAGKAGGLPKGSHRTHGGSRGGNVLSALLRHTAGEKGVKITTALIIKPIRPQAGEAESRVSLISLPETARSLQQDRIVIPTSDAVPTKWGEGVVADVAQPIFDDECRGGSHCSSRMGPLGFVGVTQWHRAFLLRQRRMAWDSRGKEILAAELRLNPNTSAIKMVVPGRPGNGRHQLRESRRDGDGPSDALRKVAFAAILRPRQNSPISVAQAMGALLSAFQPSFHRDVHGREEKRDSKFGER